MCRVRVSGRSTRSCSTPSSSTATCCRRSTRATARCGSWVRASGSPTAARASTGRRPPSASTRTKSSPKRATRRRRSSGYEARPSSECLEGNRAVKLGIWTPLPHTIPAEPRLDAAIVDLRTRGVGAEVDRSLQFAIDVVTRGEHYGAVTTLIAERFLGPDLEAWMLSAALAGKTQSIELMVAVHPGIVAPQVVAKMGASLDRISGGRFAVNIVNGWFEEEFNLFSNGAWLGDETRRYRRMDEFIRVMKGLWTEDSYSFDGEFDTVDGGSLPIKTLRTPYPTIYAGSRAGPGKEIVARECDVWFVAYQPSYGLYEENARSIQREVQAMETRARALGRTIRHGISAHVI